MNSTPLGVRTPLVLADCCSGAAVLSSDPFITHIYNDAGMCTIHRTYLTLGLGSVVDMMLRCTIALLPQGLIVRLWVWCGVSWHTDNCCNIRFEPTYVVSSLTLYAAHSVSTVVTSSQPKLQCSTSSASNAIPLHTSLQHLQARNIQHKSKTKLNDTHSTQKARDTCSRHAGK